MDIPSIELPDIDGIWMSGEVIYILNRLLMQDPQDPDVATLLKDLHGYRKFKCCNGCVIGFSK